jgi:hypothetical protein
MRFTPHQSLAVAEEASAPSDGGGGGGGGGFGVWLPPRSLLLFTDDVYTGFLHGIQDVAADAMDDSVVNWRRAAELCPGRSELLLVGPSVSTHVRQCLTRAPP